MAKLILVCFGLFAAVVGMADTRPAGTAAAPTKPASLRLEPVAMVRIPAKTKFKNTLIGGLSALAYADGKAVFLSDDRGRRDPSRFYEADLKIVDRRIELTWTAVRFIEGVPGVPSLSRVLDPEGLIRRPDGRLLISSEADTNRKPREQNRLLRLSAEGRFESEETFPEDVQPNLTGRQTRGTLNNAGPEGLTQCRDGSVWTAMERGLIQRKNARQTRFDRWIEREGRLRVDATKIYGMELPGATEVFRGVSEILCRPDGRLLVLERAVKVGGGDGVISCAGGLFLADCAKDVCTKIQVLDFDDLAKFRGGGSVPNYEGLAEGPNLPDGTPTLLLLSDDNFDSSDGAEIIALAVKEAP